MEKKNINLTMLFEENLKVLEKKLLQEADKDEKASKNPKKAAARARETALVKALEGLVNFCVSVCSCKIHYGEIQKQKLCRAPVSDLDYTLVGIYNEYFKGLKKEVMTLSQTVKPYDAIISEKLKHDFGKKTLPQKQPDTADSAEKPEKLEKAEKKKSIGFFKKR